MMKKFSMVFSPFLISILANGQHISLDNLLKMRTENVDTVQSTLSREGYKLYSVKEPKNGELASGNIRYQFKGKSIFFITVWANPNLHEMYNSDNILDVEFKDKTSDSLYRKQILAANFKLVKTVYKEGQIINYYYKQTGNYKIQADFLIYNIFSATYSPKEKANTFLLEITTPTKCPECLRFALED